MIVSGVTRNFFPGEQNVGFGGQKSPSEALVGLGTMPQKLTTS